MPRNQNETLMDYAARLEKELGPETSRARIASFKASNYGLKILTVGQRVQALETSATPATANPQPTLPPVIASPAQSDTVPASGEPELHGRALVVASIRADLSRQGAVPPASGHSAASTSKPPVAPRPSAPQPSAAPTEASLKGFAAVQASIRSQLKDQGVPEHSLSPTVVRTSA